MGTDPIRISAIKETRKVYHILAKSCLEKKTITKKNPTKKQRKNC
jgi:hypothetical protein